MSENKRIYPCLWFDGKAKEAAQFYCSIFPEAKIIDESSLVVTFEAMGQKFMCLNGGPEFTFDEAVSFVVNCETQEEIDYYWSRLTEGGQEVQCGWLKDKFGLSWQIVPVILAELLSDSKRAERVMAAFMKMKKFNISELLRA